MTDIMRTGRALAEAVREKVRLERELSIVTARINTLSAEIMSAVEVTALNSVQPEFVDGAMPRDMGDCPPSCTEAKRHLHTPSGTLWFLRAPVR